MALHPLRKKISGKTQENRGPICKPLDLMSDVTSFLNQPPAWRTLCKGLTPHSKNKLKNMEIIDRNRDDIHLEAPGTFCHYDPDAKDKDVLRYDENTLPKTLVCHDMANGYHDDSYIEGTTNHAGYTFYNWAAIDIFCYFSHHFITIPPVAWINVAHEHGVKVIGTIITEWNEGVELWDKILSSESEATNVASSLVTIASTLKFDGWLLNIENKISSPEKLLDFLRIFYRMLHKELEDGILIWYDGVTIKGNLNWQNGLTEKNKAFFDVCDGIFTNYSWEEKDLQGSVEMAGDRILDLYIGVDIWGRNFYGGGRLNTQEAMSVVHRYGCSVALFAPAWTHEALSLDPFDINGVSMSEGLDKCELFFLRDRALWGSLWPFLSTRVPCQLPFKTSFCRGMGRQRRMYGEVLCNSTWYNLRHQQYQPNSAHGSHGYLITSFDVILRHVNDYKEQKGILRYRDSFQSGSCLRKHDSEQDLSVYSHGVEWNKPEEQIDIDYQSDSHHESKHVHGISNSADVEKHVHGLRDRSDDKKHVHGPHDINDDEKKRIEGTSESSWPSDEKKRNLRRSSSWTSLKQSVKKVFTKLKHPKSLSEITQSDRLPPAQSAQSQAENSPKSSDQTLPKYLDHSSDQNSAKPSDQTSDQSSAHEKGKEKEDMEQPKTKEDVDQPKIKEDMDQPRTKTCFQSEIETIHSEAVGGVPSSEYNDLDDDTDSMDAGPSVPLVKPTPNKSMQQMSVKIHLSTRQRRAFGLSCVPGEMECLEFWLEDSFNGGACLRIHPSDEASPRHRYSRLFHCDFLCKPTMLICVVTKVAPASRQCLNILLNMDNVNSEPLTVVLIGRDMPQLKKQQPAATGQLSVPPLDEAALAALRGALLADHPACYVPLHNDFGWRVRYYQVSLPGCRITSVCCHALLADEPVLLGHFAIVPLNLQKGYLQ